MGDDLINWIIQKRTLDFEQLFICMQFFKNGSLRK